MAEPLSKITETIEAYNDFLWGLADSAGEEDCIKEYINHLQLQNEEGKYEAWMKSRWGDLKWWIAAAINYNNTTLERIRSGKFRGTQLEKIEKNSMTKNKSKFKPQLVDAWHEYCDAHNVDKYVFEMARIEGIDYNK